MACGIPVVSTRLEGMINYSGKTDAVTYRELDESFVQAVIDLLESPALHDEKAKYGRNLVVSKGTWNEFVRDFAKLSESLIVKR